VTTGAARRRVAAALFTTLAGVYGYFFQGGGWNQNSRLAQVRATVEGGTLAVNDYLLYRHRGRHRLVRDPIPPGTPWESVAERASSGDVAIAPATGRIFPNKPPGVLVAAAPSYLVAVAVERALGRDPDDWSVLTFNAHLVTALSVGLAGASTAVALFTLSCAVFPAAPLVAHAAAALTCGLGTLMLPFSTVLFDHALAAFWAVAAFALVVVDPRRPLLAGLAAGMGIVTNYTGAAAAALLLPYLLARAGPRDTLRYAAGLLPPLLLLGLYQAMCFGSPLAVANLYQNRAFGEDERVLRVFSWPDPSVLWRLLTGQRGLLVTSPVLAMAVWGLAAAWRTGKRAEAAVAAGFFACLWIFNAAFNAWQSGWSVGPRYLVPAIPFLSLGLTPAFARLPRITTALAAVSALLLLLVTAVDVQPPRRAGRPLIDYAWPLWRGQAVRVYDDDLRGPVSVNPVGVYEGGYYKVFPPNSRVPEWNSYNLGELLWPARRLSLLPLAAWIGAGLAVTLRRAREAG
jgi:hypothetical protein